MHRTCLLSHKHTLRASSSVSPIIVAGSHLIFASWRMSSMWRSMHSDPGSGLWAMGTKNPVRSVWR